MTDKLLEGDKEKELLWNRFVENKPLSKVISYT